MVRALTDALREVCLDVHAPNEPVLRKLQNLQHLHTPVTGRLGKDLTILDIAAHVHPTPAVGGFPTEEALQVIRDNEPDRGWYAGPVGWLNQRGEGEFAVALRSALLHGQQAAPLPGAASWPIPIRTPSIASRASSCVRCYQLWEVVFRGLPERLMPSWGHLSLNWPGAASGTSSFAPGSRSTPLAVLFAEHSDVRVWTHIDERSAAFFALGLAKGLREPVALVCSSGTAAANFYPAVIEARYGRVPLLVLTADRPHEFRDVGAPQAIDQIGLYGSHVKWFVEMPIPESSTALMRYARTVASRAVGSRAGRLVDPCT